MSTAASEVHVRLKTTGTERNTSIAGPREGLRWNGKIRQSKRKFINLKILSCIKKPNKIAITKKKSKQKEKEKKKRGEKGSARNRT